MSTLLTSARSTAVKCKSQLKVTNLFPPDICVTWQLSEPGMGQCATKADHTKSPTGKLSRSRSLTLTVMEEQQDDYSDDFDEEEEEEEANESSSENDEPSMGMEGLPPYTYQENDSVRLWELEICKPQSNLKLTSSLQEHFL